MFKQAILNSVKNHGGNIISDGKYMCTYEELPGIFEAMDAFMTDSGMAPGDGCVLRCGNSLFEAATLLWMLCREKDFVLLPRLTTKTQSELEDLNLPSFCKYKALLSESVQPDAGQHIDLKNPSSYLAVLPNSTYDEGAEQDVRQIDIGAKVFLRTSGSTSEPKLAMHSDENLTRNAGNCVERFRLMAQSRVLIAVPIYHMYGLGAGFLPAAMAGASIRLIDQTNIIKYLDQEKQFQPDVSFMTPTLIEMALRTRKSTYHYRLVVTAGDRINKTTYVDFENKFGPLVNLYGSTELGAIATSNLSDPLETRSNGVVHVMPGVEARPATGEKENEMAEIMCRHDAGFDAYVDKQGKQIPGKTDGWFMTKDLGRMVSENVFKVAGRTGNSINRNGILVSFTEVESLMEQGIAEVQFAVAAAKEEENVRGKVLAACCQLKPGTGSDGIDAAGIRSRCFDIMPRHMVPDQVLVMAEIPRLPNGKFDRKKINEIINDIRK